MKHRIGNCELSKKSIFRSRMIRMRSLNQAFILRLNRRLFRMWQRLTIQQFRFQKMKLLRQTYDRNENKEAKSWMIRKTCSRKLLVHLIAVIPYNRSPSLERSKK